GMIPFRKGVLTAFANVANNPNLHRIHFSSDGEGLGTGTVEYEGVSPVTAMSQYSNCGKGDALVGDPNPSFGDFLAAFEMAQRFSRDLERVWDTYGHRLRMGRPDSNGGGIQGGGGGGRERSGGRDCTDVRPGIGRDRFSK